jgi:hypothetical protein
MRKIVELNEHPFIFTVNEIIEEIQLEECDETITKSCGHKISVGPNYYDITLPDREILLTLLKDWSEEELKKAAKIKTNNRPEV